ncbi:MAG: sodium/proline symporter PutP [Clostridia bacterium]|nr:sodium/proline symporter PutP [Clostridia bacterium]
MKNPEIFVVMILYMCVVIGIGVYFYKRAQKNSENYFLGGRSLGPWVAAMSAEASDMSGWLLMGLPGVAYWCGLADAFWTAVGLAIGTYVNWLIVAKRLRHYSQIAGNSITIPDFFSNRFKEKRKIVLGISAIFILIFFTVYASSCFVTVGKLFSTLFEFDYHITLIVGAVFVVAYTLIGGFLAESVSDFMQAIVMILALVVMIVVGVVNAGGFGAVIDNVKNFDGFLSLFKIASPTTDANGVQQALGGVPLFGEAGDYGFLKILSMLAWGLGYFGVPQVLLRFMAIRKSSEIRRSRIIATVWCVISLAAAVMIGIIGRTLLPTSEALNTASNAENILIVLSTEYLPLIVAGLIMAGILAATISSSDSYLLIASSSVSVNIFNGIIKKGKATDKQVMWLSRIVLVIIAVIGVIMAWKEDNIIFNLVSFAWAGFGATFGPIMLFSLFWKRTTRAGAIAGMITGGVSVFIWKLVLNKFLSATLPIFGLYELLPAFILSSIAIVVVSLLTKKKLDNEILDEFERAKRGEVDEIVSEKANG